jgi:hypothetical protein
VAVHDEALVVQPLDGTSRLEEADLEGKARGLRPFVDPRQRLIVRPRLRLDGRPTSVQEDPDHDAASGRLERGLEERARRAPPGLFEIEGFEGDALPCGREHAQDTVRIEGRVRA